MLLIDQYVISFGSANPPWASPNYGDTMNKRTTTEVEDEKTERFGVVSLKVGDKQTCRLERQI